MFDFSVLAHTGLLVRASLRSYSGTGRTTAFRQTTKPKVGMPESSTIPRGESMEREM